MKKTDIVDLVHEKLGGTKKQAEEAVDTVFMAITDSLKKRDKVSISDFGIFDAKARAARKARNPRTGEMVDVPATTVPKFRASRALKEAVK
ncbi:MAG: DNA-binding protein [Candidatus Niyogibacteria bacterium CG10_big_fil_rev_8_21_14_0_10_46_36]|uniref:DNA-binding protein n=1 Tax=Candidatus Niyogibacteria bacterium CG10_big_fil_rev_8_21_14_0_10_46_36 TaxID=1974726 RepID=A0A2H0TCP2_9BACT|nr:MAG: DNA-binding protein [Candidatus Niyogibacteria bacterium CG10_big_fil_rev_8_21_14_0_10_46_36]